MTIVPRLALVAVTLLLTLMTGRAEAHDQPTIGGYTLVETKTTASYRYLTFRAQLTNHLPVAITGVWATLSCRTPASEVSDGTLSFPDAEPHSTVTSLDTFTLRLPRSLSFNPAHLDWTIRYKTRNGVAVADAGPDQTVTRGARVDLDGSGSSDPEGQPLSFTWKFVSRPAMSYAVLSSATAVRPKFVADRDGVYVVELVVSDGKNKSAPDRVQVSTGAGNTRPVAGAGGDQTVVVGTVVQLDGSASTDADGDALTFRWRFITLPPQSGVVLSNPAAVRPTFQVDRRGTYVAELVVNDGRLDSVADTVQISTLNSRPVAVAGADQTVDRGDTVALDGRASADVDGDSLTFAWAFVERPTGSQATLTDPAAPTPAFVADLPGRYVVQLVVNDGLVDSVPDTVQIDTRNSRPVAVAGPDQSIATGATVKLDGRASADADGDVLTFRWSFTARPDGSAAAFDDPTAAAPAFVADVAGTYVAQLIVNDGTEDGLADTVVVTTAAVNGPPVADAGPDQTAATGATVRLDGSASFDPDGPTPPTFAWTLSRPDGSTAVLSNATIARPTFVADRAGPYVAQLVVSDGALSSQADSVTITVQDGADLRIAFAGPPTTPPVGGSVSLVVEVVNDGPASASGVSARFQVPAGYAVASTATTGSAGTGGTYDGTTGTWTIGSVAAAGLARLTVAATVKAAGPYDLTAAITASSPTDPNLANNTASVLVVPNPNADLRIAFSDVPTTPAVGAGVTFAVEVVNDGPASTTGVAARFQPPAGYTVTGATTTASFGSGGTYDNATGNWVIGSMPAAGLARLAVSATVNATGPYDVTATITASGQPDPNPANNTATASVVPSGGAADLRIFFFDPPVAPPIGATASFFVEVDNGGPTAASGITALFKIPAGYAQVNGGPQVGTYDVATGLWTIGAMPSGGLARLILSAVVQPTGPYDLTATITGSSQPDPNPANNTVTAVVTPNRNADLTISFFDPPSGTRSPGSVVSLFVEVRSAGPSSTTGVRVSFPIPAGYAILNGGPQVGTYDGTTGEWIIGAMPSSGLARLILGATVNATGSTALTATITGSDQPDPNPANNTVSVSPINRPPVAGIGPDQTASTNTTVTLDGRGSGDAEGDALTFQWTFVLRPVNSTATLVGANTSTPSFIPDQGGTYRVQLVVTDVHGSASAATTTTIVASVGNHAPTIRSVPPTAATAGQPYRYAVDAADPDVGDVLTFVLPTAPAGMTITPATGAIQWTPSEAQGGPQAVVVRVQEQTGLFATQAFEIQVSSAANQAPVAVDDAYEARLGEALGVAAPGVLANDTDANGGPLAAVLMTQPTNGALSFNADGSFTYAPHTLQAGELVLAENVNLAARLSGVIVNASGFFPGRSPALVIDENLSTSWISGRGDNPVFLEVVFPLDVTVTQVQLFGHRDPNLQNSKITAGIFQVFAGDGTELHNTGAVELPAPNRDAMLILPGLTGVRRVRFTATAGDSDLGFVGFAELKVIGSALIRRELVLEPNLVQLVPTAVQASSFIAPNTPESVLDDNTDTNWYAGSFAAGEFIEITFPLDVTVTGLETRTPSARPDGFGSSDPILCRGTFQLFDASDTVRFDTGVVDTPVNDRGTGAALFTLPIPTTTGVRRLRYTVSSCAGSSFPAGFSELRVLGAAPLTTPAFQVAKKFQVLLGREVHSTPIVINLTDDNGDGRIDAHDIPDIVVPVESLTNQLTGEIKVLSGDDGRELFTAGAPGMVSPWSELAAGDLDGQGFPTIVAVHSDGNHLIAFDHTGAVKWLSDPNPMPRFAIGESFLIGGAVSIANLDGGPRPHIIVGASVFDADGRLLGDGRTLGGTTGGIGLRSAISAVADIDLDGTPELVAGPTAYRLVNGQLTKVWQRTDRADGYVAIANFDDDPRAEIVVVANGFVYMLHHDGTDAEVWNPPSHAPVAIPGGGQGGAPLIVDVDGDGIPEIGVAGASHYVLFNRDGSVRWKAAISDRSSNSTGAVAFDLDGDGQVEIIYRDERFLRIFRGADGVLLAKVPVQSSTWAEQPVVVDVDNDGHADIVVTSDLFTGATGDTGVLVFQDVANKWTRTRRIWNQHSYHVTNVNEDGTVPAVETPHWLVPGLDAFRTNAFVPGESADASDSFTYVATDGILDSNVATVRLAVRTPNSAPRFTSSPITSAATGVPYTYAARASDPDAGDVLTFSLPAAPAGMTIEPASGLVRWTPAAAQLGGQAVVVKVQDAHGLFALQSYTAQVAAPVTVPNVVGQAQTTAQTAITSAALSVGSVATHTSATVTAGAVISQNPAAGTLAARGAPVSLVVSLGAPPVGAIPDVVGQAQAGAQADIAAAGFVVGQLTGLNTAVVPLGVVLSQNPSAGTLAAPGSAVSLVVSLGPPPGDIDFDRDGFTGNQGDCNDTNAAINPNAIDIAGDGIDQNCNGRDSIAGDTTSPAVSIAIPADDAIITLPTDIVGTVTDANLLRYAIDLAPVGRGTFVRIASGTAPATGGVLGRLDPTLLENGLYRLRLTAEDVNGQLTVLDRVVRVQGLAKVGHVRLSFIDLSVPVAGIPVTVVRTYDSRVKTAEDFGVGWTLDVKRGFYQHNRTPGEAWQILPSGFPALPCRTISETAAHLTEVRLSDDEAYTFALTLSNPFALAGGCQANAGFRFIDGPRGGATLEILDGTDVFYLNGDSQIVDQNTFLVYNPSKVRLTTADGRVFDLDRNTGITRIQDTNGNALTITDAGIVHSSGPSVAFVRDPLGRITRMTDPAGHTLTYAYDPDTGDLVAVTDPLANRTTFTYDTRHNLREIHDPLGRRPLRAEYDDDGRLVAVTDAAGQRTTFGHDLASRQEVVTDRLGHSSGVEYDARGNVVRRTDPLGNVTTATYDPRDNPLSITDPLGHTQRFTYDAADNVLTETDPLAHPVTYTYNSRNQELTRTDPLGGTIRRAYDAKGNVVTLTDVLGHATGYTYDDRGNLLTTVDPLGTTSTFEYDASGRQLGAIDPLGHVTTYGYDASGNRASETRTRTTAGGAIEVVRTTYVYDALNRLVQTVQPDGSTRTTYDGVGQIVAVERPAGRTTYAYDEQGRLISTGLADGTSRGSAYDAEGRKVATTDQAGLTTRYQLDALGRVTQITYPDGATSGTAYDGAGHVLSTTDTRGHTTSSEYDAAGRRTRTVDALGNATTLAYDAAGRVVSLTSSRGNVTRYEHDDAGRGTRVIHPDGSDERVAYDDAGRVSTRIDPLGRATRYQYDALGRLTAVTDALDQVTSYAYDELGNRRTQTDAAGSTTRFEYDALGRRTKRILPLGQTDSVAYDVTGVLSSRTDFEGRTTTYGYDALRRVVRRTPDPRLDEPPVTFTYTATGRRASMTDASGTTVYTYDARDRLIHKATPRGTLSYAYDTEGNVLSIRSSNPNGAAADYTYDELNRLSSVADGRLPAGQTMTLYAYDAEGNLLSRTDSNGVVSTGTYDALNRAVRLSIASPARPLAEYTHALDGSGSRVSVGELNGRTVRYTYDPLYRLTGETIAGDPAGNNGALTYTYDAAGNRLARTSTVPAVSPASYGYDADNRLTRDGYDRNGNTIATSGATYAYDSENRLTSAGGGAVTFVYDGDGHRVSKSVNGTITEFLVDDQNPTGHAQVLEEIVGGAVERVATYGRGLISQRSADGTVRFHHHDGQGSVRLLTDTAAAPTDTYDYEAFGSLLRAGGDTPTSYRFRGEEFDATLGAYYLRSRYYQPDTGRFLTADTWEGDTTRPLTLHAYAYPSSNPVMLADPTGHIGLAEVGASLAISGTLSQLSIVTPAPQGVKGGGPFKNVVVDVVTWLVGADPFVEHVTAANTIFGTNGVHIKVTPGRYRELPEDRLGYVFGRDNAIEDGCQGARGELVPEEVRRLIGEVPRTPGRITLYYVPKLKSGADGLTFHTRSCDPGGFAGGEPPFVVLSTAVWYDDTLAHELGHAIADLDDLTTDNFRSRLMYGYGNRTGHVVLPAEIKRLRASPYLSP